MSEAMSKHQRHRDARSARILGRIERRFNPQPMKRERTGGDEILDWLKANPSPEALGWLKQAMRAGVVEANLNLSPRDSAEPAKT